MVTTMARIGPSHQLEKPLCDLSTDHILQTLTAARLKPALTIFSKPGLNPHLVKLQMKLTSVIPVNATPQKGHIFIMYLQTGFPRPAWLPNEVVRLN